MLIIQQTSDKKELFIEIPSHGYIYFYLAAAMPLLSLPYLVYSEVFNTELALSQPFKIFWFTIGTSITLVFLGKLFEKKKTQLGIFGGRLFVRHFNLFSKKTSQISARHIKQLYCKRKVIRSMANAPGREIIKLRMLLKNGKHVTLMHGFSDIASAVEIETIVEGFLGLEDEPVEGESSKAHAIKSPNLEENQDWTVTDENEGWVI